MNKSDCNGIGGWLWGHKYQARFDEKDHLPPANYSIESIDLKGLKALRTEEKTYVHDICIRCGSKILR